MLQIAEDDRARQSDLVLRVVGAAVGILRLYLDGPGEIDLLQDAGDAGQIDISLAKRDILDSPRIRLSASAEAGLS